MPGGRATGGVHHGMRSPATGPDGTKMDETMSRNVHCAKLGLFEQSWDDPCLSSVSFSFQKTLEVGGSESAFRQAPRNREIVSFRACVRRAVSGCEVEFRCKIVAGALSLFPFHLGRLSLFPLGLRIPLSPTSYPA